MNTPSQLKQSIVKIYEHKIPEELTRECVLDVRYHGTWTTRVSNGEILMFGLSRAHSSRG